MSWETTLQEASFRGVTFWVRSLSDPESKAIALNEYPWVDGADVTDMGQRAVRHTIQAFLFGPTYEDELAQLLAALRARGAGVLVHPIIGVISKVVADQWHVEHDHQKPDACTISMSFVESNTYAVTVFGGVSKTGRIDRVSAGAATAQGRADKALTDRLASVARDALSRIAALSAVLKASRSRSNALLAVTGGAVTTADLDPVAYPSSWVADSQATVDAAFSGLSFGGMNDQFNGPTSTDGSALSDFNQVASQMNPAAVVIASTSVEPDALADAAVVQAWARAQAACVQAEAASFVLQAEVERITLDRRDLERLVAVVRTALQLAIDDARASLGREAGAALAGDLAQTAYAIQEAARSIIQQRPPVVTRVSPLSGHLRVLAHAWYGDHARAAELLRLNSWGRQVFVERGQEVQAYAR